MQNPTADHVIDEELSEAVAAAVAAAVKAALATRRQEKKKPPPPASKVKQPIANNGPIEPPPTVSEVERQQIDGSTELPRSRSSFRGRPEPAQFDLDGLPDSALLREREVASIGRWSVNSVSTWRSVPNHPLRWLHVGNGEVRYRVGDLRAFLASGKRPKRTGRPPTRRRTASGLTSAPESVP